MANLKSKINTLTTLFITILIIIILFIDSDTLNSLYINNNNELVINQVNTYKEEKVVTNNTSAEPTNKVTLISNPAPVDKWVWPTVNNYILTSHYSYYHKALDIAGSNGSNIYAANSGVVTSVKGGCVVGNLSCNGRGGNYVVIKHNTNNYYTMYMHLKDIYVTVGQTVLSNQVIGTMGNTGNVIPIPTSSNPYAGTHLHFCLYIGEPYKGGYAINPMNLY